MHRFLVLVMVLVCVAVGGNGSPRRTAAIRRQQQNQVKSSSLKAANEVSIIAAGGVSLGGNCNDVEYFKNSLESDQVETSGKFYSTVEDYHQNAYAFLYTVDELGRNGFVVDNTVVHIPTTFAGQQGLWSYDLISNKWTTFFLPQKIEQDLTEMAFIQSQGKLISLGGGGLEVFEHDLQTLRANPNHNATLGAPKQVAQLPAMPLTECVVSVNDGKSVLFISESAQQQALYRSDDGAKTWTKLMDIPANANKVMQSAKCIVLNDDVMFIASSNAVDGQTSLATYTLSSNKFEVVQAVPKMGKERRGFSMAAFPTPVETKMNVLVCGGRGKPRKGGNNGVSLVVNAKFEPCAYFGTATATCEIYDVEKNEWIKPDFQFRNERADFGLFVVPALKKKN